MGYLLKLLVAVSIVFNCQFLIAGTLLFSDNFDDGDTTNWTTSLCSASTDVAYSGSYSVKCTHSGTALLRLDYFSEATMLNYSEITIVYKWYTANSWIDGAGVKYARLRNSSQSLQQELWWSEDFGNEPLYLDGILYGSDVPSTDTNFGGGYQAYNRGSWVTIKIHYIYNTIGQSDGTMQIYFDDVLKINRSNVAIRDQNTVAFHQFYLPSNIGTSNANNINYIDDVEIWYGEADSETSRTAAGVTFSGASFY